MPMRNADGTTKMVDSVTETTEAVAPRERWAYWKDTAMAAVDGVRLARADRFSASRTLTPLRSGLLVETSSDPIAARRTARNIARDGDDAVCLMILSEGRAVIESSRGGAKSLEPGEIGLFDLSRPYVVGVPVPYRERRVYLPRAGFSARVGRIEDLAGLRIPVDDPLSVLFSAYAKGLFAALPSMTSAQADVGLDGALHLLSNLVAGRSGVVRDEGGRMPDGTVLDMAERHIVALAGNHDLDVAMLARVVGLSRTRLYKAFERRGGVAAVIRDTRLDRAGRRLLDPAARHVSIQRIAHESGFSDYATFARVFRRRFGMTAGDWRKG